MRRPSDLILGLVLLCGVYLWQRTTFPLWHVDLFHIQLAALSWHNDRPEMMYTDYAQFDEWANGYYRIEAERLGAWGDANAHFYPPFLAGALAPWADTEADHWGNTVFVLNALLIFVFAWQILRFLDTPWNARGFLWALAFALLCYPLARATKLGQIGPLLAVLLNEGLLLLKRRREVCSGVLIGIVGSLKLFPIGWIIWPVIARVWRHGFAVVATLALVYGSGIAWMGPDIFARWQHAMSEFASTVFIFYGNQAPSVWFARMFYDFGPMDRLCVPDASIALLQIVSYLIFGATTFLLLWRSRDTLSERYLYSSALLISGILLSLPVMWEHYLLFVLPLFGAILYREYHSGAKDWTSGLLYVAVFFFLMKLTRFYSDDFLGRVASGSQGFGLILFWIHLVLRVLKDRGNALQANFIPTHIPIHGRT